MVINWERSDQEGRFPKGQRRRLELSQAIGVCLSTSDLSVFHGRPVELMRDELSPALDLPSLSPAQKEVARSGPE